MFSLFAASAVAFVCHAASARGPVGCTLAGEAFTMPAGESRGQWSDILRDLNRTPASDLPSGLMLVHGNQPETLRELLVGWFARYPLEPLESEVILAGEF